MVATVVEHEALPTGLFLREEWLPWVVRPVLHYPESDSNEWRDSIPCPQGAAEHFKHIYQLLCPVCMHGFAAIRV